MALLQRTVGRPLSLALLGARLAAYWSLIKDLQTGLLLVTALAGYATGCCRNFAAPGALAVLASLFLAISGSTVLNMALDRDIDARMARTAKRPLPSGRISLAEALLLGCALTVSGVGWALSLYLPFGLVVLAGVLLDVVLYTAVLKRRTAFSVLLGGLAGGMPVLAGRVAAVGELDLIGGLLALAVLAWIPTHIMTLGMKYAEDYRRAGVPVFPNVFGVRVTRLVIAASSALAVGLVLAAGRLVAVRPAMLAGLAWTGGLLACLVLFGVLRPSQRLNFVTYKSASVYMLAAMVLLIAGA
jgi:protoheme IX farnesyltransferase